MSENAPVSIEKDTVSEWASAWLMPSEQ
jgi:hypothetical protein